MCCRRRPMADPLRRFVDWSRLIPWRRPARVRMAMSVPSASRRQTRDRLPRRRAAPDDAALKAHRRAAAVLGATEGRSGHAAAELAHIAGVGVVSVIKTMASMACWKFRAHDAAFLRAARTASGRGPRCCPSRGGRAKGLGRQGAGQPSPHLARLACRRRPKTEVYFEAIAAPLPPAGGCLCLLPENRASPHSGWSAFEDRYGRCPRTWHSGLDRWNGAETWRAIAGAGCGSWSAPVRRCSCRSAPWA